MLSIRYICDFSRGVLNVRFMRSHPTLAPRPQIYFIYQKRAVFWLGMELLFIIELFLSNCYS
ncbi:hypothetical protein DW972_05615 [Anaerobutyricum hallii]|uniref:Uncharacterized protein n=1 Tax=Anaerobutyricum hallii TaxID=39488 RepID=A0A413PYY2_9FIRM|nr:hypothetical protein DW972_05615 [Anaerobutyricum hallii]